MSEKLFKNQKDESIIENGSELYKDSLIKEVKASINLPVFLEERLGGVERYINKSLVPNLFDTPKNASSGIGYIVDYFVKENISTQDQLKFFRGLKLSLSDIILLSEDKNATFENVLFAYNWAGLAHDKWKLSQEDIKSILNSARDAFKKESVVNELPYIVSLYINPENMISSNSKIERFMQIMTPNLIDKNNSIYHFDPTGEDPIFLKLDTEQKIKFVEDFLLQIKKGWSKMFEEYTTVKMHTHYALPDEFKKFVLSENQIQDYFPHIVFDNKGEVLRKEMKNMLNPTIRDSFKKDLAIDLSELGSEQAYFVEYISNKKRGDILVLKSFIDKYNKEGLKTFLSCAHGGVEMGDNILILGEKLPEDSAKVLFKTYSEMIDATENIYDFLRQNLKEDISFEMVQKIKESLLLDGQKMLEKYADKASVCEGVSCVELGKELSEKLALAKESVFVFAYSCKALVEKGEFSFEDFEKVKLSYDQSPLPEKTKDQIIKMHQENTKQYPEKLKTFWRQTLKDGLEKENPKQMVVHVSYEEDVVSAMRVIEQEDGSWYGASFNINPTVQGSRIGIEL